VDEIDLELLGSLPDLPDIPLVIPICCSYGWILGKVKVKVVNNVWEGL
jgi:hypothetical protein